MRGSVLLMFLLIWGQDFVRCVRLTAPAHIAVGGEALLGCQFDLGSEVLYSVKWYKDDREIYRYVPSSRPDHKWFAAPGIKVDLSKSSSDMLALTNIQPETAGLYRCEITGEAPTFRQEQDEKYITVHVLPKTKPRITGLKYEYEVGDRVIANCTSPGSRPEAIIKWLVNNKPVHRAHLRGPWRRVVEDPPDTIETTLGIHYMVLPSDYRSGVMQIKCQATIVPLYHKEVAFVLNAPEPEMEASSEAVETSPEPIIPPLESGEDYLIPDEDQNRDIRDNMINEFRKIINDLDSESSAENPPATEASNEAANAKDCATLSVRSLEAMAVTLLMQVILLISILNEHVLEDYL